MDTIDQNKPKVVVIDSLQSWEFYVNQASTQNSPVSQPFHVKVWIFMMLDFLNS
jgi:predicted ATP-dependent serine protease